LSLLSPFLYVIILFVTAGFVGTERIYYLREFYGREFSLREVPRLTRRFFARFLRLSLIMGIPIGIIISLIIVVEVGIHPTRNSSGESLRVAISYLVVLLIVDALLTFVTPILVFSTGSAVEALALGLKFLRHTWPRSLWYVFTPGLSLVAIGLVFPRSEINTSLDVVISVIGGLLAFAFKGAAVPYYLRCIDVVDDDGAFS
jgi:hypothetical protein